MVKVKVRIPKKTYKRGPWTDRFGHKHPGSVVEREGYTKEVKRSHRKRTPKNKRWYEPSVEMGWEHDAPVKERRELALEAHGGDTLAAACALQALANVTTSSSTKKVAAADAAYFYAQHRKEG